MKKILVMFFALALGACSQQLKSGAASGPLCTDSAYHWSAMAALGSKGPLGYELKCDERAWTHGTMASTLGYWVRPDGSKVAANFYDDKPALHKAEQLTGR